MDRYWSFKVVSPLTRLEGVELLQAGACEVAARPPRTAGSSRFALWRPAAFTFPPYLTGKRVCAAYMPALREEIQGQFHRYLETPQVVVAVTVTPDRLYEGLTRTRRILSLDFTHQKHYKGLNNSELDRLVSEMLAGPFQRIRVFVNDRLRVVKFVLEPLGGKATFPLCELHLTRDLQFIATPKPAVSEQPQRKSLLHALA